MRISSGPERKAKLRKIRRLIKGYYSQRGRQLKHAKEAIIRAGRHSYNGRKQKKRDYRSLWIIRLTAALTQYQISYSEFINKLKKSSIKLNRKVLTEIAIHEPELFKEVVGKATSAK
ncbi:MAG: 50S ribosomal protein L20 [Planctomycetes bacterium]|nr:50S ribosomal protein L20 [Planctomycetota bacterium]